MKVPLTQISLASHPSVPSTMRIGDKTVTLWPGETYKILPEDVGKPIIRVMNFASPLVMSRPILKKGGE